MTTQVGIAEMALRRVGITTPLAGDSDGTLAGLSDESLAKELVEKVYPEAIERVLAEFPWQFARKNQKLTLASDLEDTTDYWGWEWQYAYHYPGDCIQLRRFMNDRSPGYGYYGGYYSDIEPWPWPDQTLYAFVVREHDDQKVILTNVEEVDAVIIYTRDFSAAEDAPRLPPTFVSALAWLIAHEIVPGLERDMQLAKDAFQMYQQQYSESAAKNTNENTPMRDPDQPFLAARSGR